MWDAGIPRNSRVERIEGSYAQDSVEGIILGNPFSARRTKSDSWAGRESECLILSWASIFTYQV